MKVLFISKGFGGLPTSYVLAQGESLKAIGVEVSYFLVERSGLFGYLRAFPKLLSAIVAFNPDILHAHNGLYGLFANLSFLKPVVTTYHGSDINNPKTRIFSQISFFLSVHNIVVAKSLLGKMRFPLERKSTIIPCGIDLASFNEIDKKSARQEMRLQKDATLILFSNYFSTPEKNAELAIKAVKLIPNAQLIELKGYSQSEVNLLLNACDVALMTSFTEGSPLFIKEAMACNMPIVSTDVGDVKELIEKIEGCFIASFDEYNVARSIEQALDFERSINARSVVERFDERLIAEQILGIYKQFVKQK